MLSVLVKHIRSALHKIDFIPSRKNSPSFTLAAKKYKNRLATNAPKFLTCFVFWYFQAKLVQLSPKLLQESKELVEETKRAKWAFKLTNAEATRAYKLSLRRV